MSDKNTTNSEVTDDTANPSSNNEEYEHERATVDARPPEEKIGFRDIGSYIYEEPALWLMRVAIIPALLGVIYIYRGLNAGDGIVMIGTSVVATAFFAMALTLLVGSIALTVEVADR